MKQSIENKTVRRSENPGSGATSNVVGIICPPPPDWDSADWSSKIPHSHPCSDAPEYTYLWTAWNYISLSTNSLIFSWHKKQHNKQRSFQLTGWMNLLLGNVANCPGSQLVAIFQLRLNVVFQLAEVFKLTKIAAS